MRRLLTLAAIAAAAPALAHAADPVKLTNSEALAIFSRPEARAQEFGGIKTGNYTILRSPDQRMLVGVYKMTAGTFPAGPNGYGLTEFAYVLKGKLRLVGADGKVIEAGPGESITIERGWKGTWGATEETTYYYVANTLPRETPPATANVPAQ
ncbi:cupin domain-containing protein [Phenylobacterium sp.]|jgi:uncharacterized cupin superfamily protein|uniref:cupin domain-containing protein n=1 Tax=Phenylobacterium sp. TaxID=1871053 RepID=UPI0037846BF2